MRLLIISNMPHHLRADGRVVGWGPTVQEIDHLATRFDEVRHIACLHDGEPSASFLPYADDRVQLIGMSPTGGDRLRDKLHVVMAAPRYASTMLRELARADMVHLRCAANLPMIGVSLLPFVRRPSARWIKYAGNWRPDRHDSIAFAFQRWFLARAWHRGTVTVNGHWPDQPAHIKSFYNPSLTAEEIESARALVIEKQLTSPVRLLFVGRLEPAKGCALALETLAQLVADGVAATLDLIGDGPDREAYERQAEGLGIRSLVSFHGWLPRTALAEHYGAAHLMLLPSVSEGWPKVLSEGMAYGVVPIASAVGAIAEYLDRFGVGRAIAPGGANAAAYANAVAAYARHPDRWLAESRRGLVEVEKFSYAYYLRAIDEMLATMAVQPSASPGAGPRVS